MREKIRPRTLNGNPQQQQVTDKIPKINPAVRIGIGFRHLPAVEAPAFRRRDGRRRAAPKTAREFRQQADEIPVLRAVHKNRRPAFNAAFGNPLPDLFERCRAVFLAVLADDFVDRHVHSSSLSRVRAARVRADAALCLTPQNPAKFSPPGC